MVTNMETDEDKKKRLREQQKELSRQLKQIKDEDSAKGPDPIRDLEETAEKAMKEMRRMARL